MLDKSTCIPTLLERLDKIAVGHALDIRTYKRNRSVVFVKLSGNEFRVLQNGYENLEHRVSLAKMPKFLKTVLKKEFPRSNKVRLYDLGPFDQNATSHLQRKIL